MGRLKRALLALGLFLVACGQGERPLSEGGDAVDGGRLIRRLEASPPSLNALLESTGYERDVLNYIHDGLVEYDKNLKVIPSLAQSWEVSSDGKTFIFHLDPRATFSDGTHVQANDVLFTLKKIVDPKSTATQLASLFQDLDLQQSQALSDTTLRVVFGKARPSQLEAFSIPILPEHFYTRGDFAKDYNRKVMGAGPYVLKEFKPGQSVRLVRREDYWREKPHVREILFKVISDDNVAWNALLAGELDETKVNSDVWKKEKENRVLQDRIVFHRFYLLSYNFIPWNTRDPILSDKRVRKALAMSLDRRSIIQNLFYGTARLISGPYTPDQWAYDPEVKPIEFDPSGAKKLLAEAGWSDTNNDHILDKNGQPLQIEILLPAGNATSAAQGQTFQHALKGIGVDLKLTTLDASALFQRLFAGQYQGAFLQWDSDLDPDLYAVFHSSQLPPSGQNFVFYTNPQLDQLIEHARTELNPVERAKLYHQIHRFLAEEQPYLWTLQVSEKWAVSKRVHSVEESNGLGLFFWYPGARQWWLEPRRK